MTVHSNTEWVLRIPGVTNPAESPLALTDRRDRRGAARARARRRPGRVRGSSNEAHVQLWEARSNAKTA